VGAQVPTLSSPLFSDSISMQPTALALIACLAPLPAAAFGDMDCIALESCTADACTPFSDLTTDLTLFSVSFDWGAQQANVTSNDETMALPLIQRPRSTVSNGDAPIMETTALFGDPSTGHLRIQGQDSASGQSLIALWTRSSASSATLRARCDLRTAA
jgi:hypothetical protein